MIPYRAKIGWTVTVAVLTLFFMVRPGHAQTQTELCEEMAQVMQGLLEHTVYSNVSKLVKQPYFNEAVFMNYLTLSDEMKMFYLADDIAALNHARFHNINQLVTIHHAHLRFVNDKENSQSTISPARHKSRHQKIRIHPQLNCDFVATSREIHSRNIVVIRRLVNELIDETMDFDQPESLSLRPYSSYANTYAELRERWSRRIKFDKLVATAYLEDNYMYGMYGEISPIISDGVKQYLKQRYNQLFELRELQDFPYLAWTRSLVGVIDPHASVVGQMEPVDWTIVHSIWPDTNSLPTHLPKLGFEKFGFMAIPQLLAPRIFYLESPHSSYPHRFGLPFVQMGSYLLAAKNYAKRLSDSTSIWRKLLVIEPAATAYRYALKSVNMKNARMKDMMHYGFTVKMGNHEVARQPQTQVLYMKLSAPLLNHDTPKTYIGRSEWYRDELLNLMKDWELDPAVIVLDLRSSRFLGFSAIQFLEVLSSFFIPRGYLLQRVNKVDQARNLIDKTVVGSEQFHRPTELFALQVPLVILLDDLSVGHAENFAHAFRLMNRALIVGSGRIARTSGEGMNVRAISRNTKLFKEKIRYSSGLNYNIDGTFQGDRGISYDLFMPRQLTPLKFELATTRNSNYPWHVFSEETVASLGYPEQIVSLKYPDYGMMNSKLMTKIKQRHQQRQTGTDGAPNSLQFPHHQEQKVSFEVTLEAKVFSQQIKESLGKDKQLRTQLNRLSRDHTEFYFNNNALDRPYVIEIIEQDDILVNTLRIATDYYYLLKRGGKLPESQQQVIGVESYEKNMNGSQSSTPIFSNIDAY